MKRGRKQKTLTPEQVFQVYSALQRGVSIKDAADDVGVSYGTLRRILRQPWKEQLDEELLAVAKVRIMSSMFRFD